MIVEALAAGVSETGKSAAKDAYESLKRLVAAWFSARPAAESVLAEHEADPVTWEKPLAKVLKESGAVASIEVITAAQEVMRLVDGAGSAAGKYQVDLRGAQGVQVGDGNRQVNLFGDGPSALA